MLYTIYKHFILIGNVQVDAFSFFVPSEFENEGRYFFEFIMLRLMIAVVFYVCLSMPPYIHSCMYVCMYMDIVGLTELIKPRRCELAEAGLERMCVRVCMWSGGVKGLGTSHLRYPSW